MANLLLPEQLIHKLEDIARQENRPVEEVISSMVEKYTPETPAEERGPDWSMILGIGDEGITDMSTTVRETLQKYYQEKYGRPD